jgi:toluene monooxygenase system ferredoxin subunit
MSLFKRDHWVRALSLADLWEGEMTGLRLGGVDLVLAHVPGGGVHAYDNRCPHGGSRLSAGTLDNLTLTCTTHLWEFDARTGEGIKPMGCRLRKFPVEVRAGEVWVRLSDHAS